MKRTKAASYRAGYERALRDVEREVDRLIAAMELVEEFASPDKTRAMDARRLLSAVRHRVLRPVRAAAKL